MQKIKIDCGHACALIETALILTAVNIAEELSENVCVAVSDQLSAKCLL